MVAWRLSKESIAETLLSGLCVPIHAADADDFEQLLQRNPRSASGAYPRSRETLFSFVVALGYSSVMPRGGPTPCVHLHIPCFIPRHTVMPCRVLRESN